MSVERPTFSESWHRIADARCRLRSGVRIVRQQYRGQTWHLVQDPAANLFFRLNDPAYRFVGLLDGNHSVGDAWRICNEQFGDESPTQGEVIQLLGQLYSSNLLGGEIPGDTESLLRRSRRRIAREVRGHLTNLLFLRIPLLDPDAFLSRWEPLVRPIYSRAGLAIWVVAVLVGLLQLAGRERDLTSGLSSVLAADNLFLLYATFAFIKLVHEMSHGFACKTFGVREAGERTGAGEVRTMGIMLMVLMPVPFVDASSAWALRGRSRRVIVAASGMMAELVLAAVAAVIWAHSPNGSVVHAIAYNAMFSAGVSTLIFNGNPLMRYDGYFMLSDLIEIPNLAQRSNEYLQFLVKKYVWRVKRPHDATVSPGERAWLLAYAPASLVYRTIVFAGLILFIAQQWFIVGIIFALVGVFTWFALPLGRFVRYLATSAELGRARGRAILTSVGATAVAALLVGAVPAPDHIRVEGVVEPIHMAVVHARSSGFVRTAMDSGTPVVAGTSTLMSADNTTLASTRREILADIDRLGVARVQALEKDVPLAQQYEKQLAAMRDRLTFVDEDLAGLTLHPPIAGTWVSPRSRDFPGSYAKRGAQVGLVADLGQLMIRATATQDAAAPLVRYRPARAEARVKGRPDQLVWAELQTILPAGQEQLPSRALGFDAGGPLQVDPSDQHGEKTIEPFFELRLGLERDTPLLPGQRVIVRFRLPDRPLAAQAWHALSQTLQRRFRI